MNLSLFEYIKVTPFASLGLSGPFWTLHLDTIIHTWFAILIIVVVAVIGRWSLKRERSLLFVAYRKSVQLFIDICAETLKSTEYRYVLFLGTLFFFTFVNCIIGLIPFLDESTKDINTTFALALASFSYITFQKIKGHGILGYLREFVEPSFVLAPMHLVGEISKIASMSFRLFGNILGGNVILSIIIEVIGVYKVMFIYFVLVSLLISFITHKMNLIYRYPLVATVERYLSYAVHTVAWIQLFFGILDGFIQSFVLMMLTTTYLSMGINTEEEKTSSSTKESTC